MTVTATELATYLNMSAPTADQLADMEETITVAEGAVFPLVSDATSPLAQLAVKVQAARWYRRRQSPEGLTFFAEEGVVTPVRGGLDADVVSMIAPIRLWRFGA